VHVFIHALLHYGHKNICVNGHRTSTVMHISSWLSPTLSASINLAALQYDRAQSSSTSLRFRLHPMRSCCRKVWFLYTNPVPLCRHAFQNEIAIAVMFSCKMCMHSCAHTPSGGNFYKYVYMLSNICTPFPTFTYFSKTISCYITWSDWSLHMFVCVWLGMFVHLSIHRC
jgi:hypothetical protein